MSSRKSMLMTAALMGCIVVASAAARAADVKPAVVYDLGGKFDKSFNEGVFNGATKFTKDTGVAFRDLEIQNDAQREQVLRKFAKDGFSPIMTVGFAWATALGKVADEFPNTKFGIIDMVVDKPNVQSIVFKEHEGSFLVGVLAAMTSKTGKVGFVGGMDIPLISKFECGYAQGVKYASDGKDEVFANMTGTTPAAWNDPVKGGELAKSQIDRGADVIYAAAGATGQGVLKAAADAGKLGSASIPTRIHVSRQGPDLDAEARRRRDLQVLHGRQGRRMEAGRSGPRPEGRRGRLRRRRVQQEPAHARAQGQGRRHQGGHHLGQDPDPRLHVRQQVPDVERLSDVAVAPTLSCPRKAGMPKRRGRLFELSGTVRVDPRIRRGAKRMRARSSA